MRSIEQSLRITLINMEIDLEHRQMIQRGVIRQMNLNDGAGPSHQFDGQVQRLRSALNDVIGLSNQLEDHTGHRHVFQNNDLPNQQQTYDQRQPMAQNAGVSPSSQSVINQTHRGIRPNGILRSSHQQVNQSISNNVAGSSIQYELYGDEIISLSSNSSTIYDSDASTASLDLAALYESQRMASNNRSGSSNDIEYDSGIDVESIDIDPMNQIDQVIEYTVGELSPIQSQFLISAPLADQPSAMRAPTPRPIPIQRMQHPAAVHHTIEPLVVPQQPPPVPPRRPMNVGENRNDGVFFRCVICMESIIGRDPHTTPCGHTLCHQDLNEWLNHYQASTCPYCRDPITYAECIRLYVI